MEDLNTTTAETSPTPEVKKKPSLLIVLCILTFIFSGICTFISLIGIFVSGLIGSMLENRIEGFGPELIAGTSLIIALGLFILFGLSLWGAILMIRLRKAGFILYVIPNGLLLIVQIIFLFLAPNLSNIFFFLVSAVFIVLYGMHLKYMK